MAHDLTPQIFLYTYPLRLRRSERQRQRMVEFIRTRAEGMGMSIFGKVREALRDKTRENFHAGLQSLGIEASMTPRGRREEHIKRAGRARSLGIIDIPDGAVRWANVQLMNNLTDSYYCATYSAPDSKITPAFPNISVKSTRVRSRWAVGDVVHVDWKGNDYGLEVVD